MITVIRNDRDARYAHDVYDIKIKDENPMYKLIGATRNEGVCLYESANYAAVAHVFNVIIEAIMSGEHSVMIMPPHNHNHSLTKEEFDPCDVHDFMKLDDDHPIKIGHDRYGRKVEDVFGNDHYVFEGKPLDTSNFYAWEENEQNIPNLGKNSFDNKFLVNSYSQQEY